MLRVQASRAFFDLGWAANPGHLSQFVLWLSDWSLDSIDRKRNKGKIMKRILIIEDEPEMLRNLTTILRLEKFRPLSAQDGRLGVDLAKKQKPDLILCDVTMPGLDGYGVIAALRADPETVSIPFIFLTANAEKLDLRTRKNLGADDYMIKPVAKADLLAAIRLRLELGLQQAMPRFEPNFHSAVPLSAKHDAHLERLPA
jgi:CheY-like chemotaxis protein